MAMFKRIMASVLAAAMLLSELPTAALAEMLEQTAVTETTVQETSEPMEEITEVSTEAAEETVPAESSEELTEPSETAESTVSAETTGPAETWETVPTATEETVPAETEPAVFTEPVLVGEELEVTAPAMESVTDNLSWAFDEDSCKLTISGSGDMADCSRWSEYKDQVELLVIQEGVTGICEAAFADMPNMYMVLLPNSLTSIGAGAFENCTGLNDIFIPAGVTHIGGSAFKGCVSLYNVQFAGYDVTLEEDCFGDVNATVYYPYDSSWSDCGSYGGNLNWRGYAKILATGLYGTGRWTVEESGSLQISGLGTVAEQTSAAGYPWYPYADSICMVGYSSLDNLPRNAFAGFKNLSTVYISQVESIGSGAFSGCGNLEDITFYGVTAIASDAFTGVTASVSFKAEDGWTEDMMRDYGGTLDWQISYSGSYGDSIGWELSGNALSVFTYTDATVQMESQTSAEGYPWYTHRERIREVYITNVSVGDYAFDGYDNLNRAQLNHTGTVGTCAFRSCDALSTVIFEGNPPEIAADAFTGVTADARYNPAYTWSETQLQNYGGTLTWSQLVHVETELASGTYGENVTWTLASSGDLTVTGEGVMESQTSGAGYPWYEYRDQISNIYVKDLTGVGDYAFAGDYTLGRLELGESVTSVGSRILDGCVSIDIVLFMGLPPVFAEDTFAGLSNTGIGYQYSLESEWAEYTNSFYGGESLWWTQYLQNIAFGTFENMYWQVREDGALIIRALQNSGTLVMPDLEEGEAPWLAYADQIDWLNLERVESIGKNAFKGLTNVTGAAFCETLTAIGDEAFAGCTAMENVWIIRTVETIGARAFADCTALSEISFQGIVGTIGEDAFRNVTAYVYCYDVWPEEKQQNYGGTLTWEYRPEWVAGDWLDGIYWDLYSDGHLVLRADELTPMPEIEPGTDYPWHSYAEQITKISTNNISSIGDHAFSGCTGLTGFLFDYHITELGDYIFYGCTNLSRLTFHGSAPEFSNNTFYTVTATVSYPTGDPTWTEEKRQNYNGNLTWLGEETGGEESTVIGGSWGENLTWSLDEAGCLTISGTGAMPEIEFVYVDDFNYYWSTPWREYNPQITSVVIGSGVTTVESRAFRGCYYVSDIFIPDTVESIGYEVFGMGVQTITVAEDNPYFCVVDGVLFDKEQTTLYCYPGQKQDKEYRLPDSVTKLRYYSVMSEYLEKITIPASVTEIEESAFCTVPDALKEVIFEGDAPNSGGMQIFWEVELTACYPQGNTTWTEEVMARYGDNITWVPYEKIISSGSCGENLTWSLSEDGTMTISGTGDMNDYDTMMMRPDWMYDAANVKRVVIEAGVTSVGSYAFFADYLNITELTLPESLVSIGDCAFGFCGMTGTLTIPDSVETIGYEAFRGCTGLTALELGSGLKTIGDGAFAGCSNLAGTVKIPAGVTKIGSNSFQFSGNITHIRFECVDCPEISGNSLGSISGLKSIYVPAANYDSYAALIANLPSGVEVQTDANAFPVEGLAVSAVYSKTVVLTWTAHESGKALGYQILRDGELVGTATECTYADRTLEPGQTYTYTVRAYFENEAATPDSGAVTATTVLPEISGLTGYLEYANKKLFAGEYNEIRVSIADHGNLEPLGQQKNTLGLYYRAGDEEILIGWARQEEEAANVYSVCWDLSILSDGEYTLRAVLTDVDGTTAEWTEAVTVDNTPPGKLLQVVANGTEENIQLSWTRAQEYDAAGYNIYRSVGTQEDFRWLARIDGATTLSFTDNTAPEDQTCYYYVVAVDIFGREAIAYDVVSSSRITDTVKPRVLQLLPAAGSCLTGTAVFTLKTEDNVGVVSTKLEYSVDREQTWTELSLAEGRYALDTTILEDGEIAVRAFAYDEAGNESDAFRQSYSIDNTGPEQVTGLSHVSTSVTMTLRWEDVADRDIGGFLVEQLHSDGSYKPVAEKVTALGVNLQGLLPDTEYTYRVTAYDIFGNAGVPSEPYTASTAADTTAPVTAQLFPASGSFRDSISLTATVEDDCGIASAMLEYSLDNVRWTELHTERYTDGAAVQKISAQLDLTDIPEGLLYVRATAVDQAGNASADPAFVQHMVDKTAPAVPSNVTATGCSGYVEVRWSAIMDAAAFRIYRAEAPDGEFSPVSDKLEALNYFDRNVTDGETYYYRVAAVDAAGNVSQCCEPVSAQASPDTQAPEILSISPADGSVLSSSFAQVSVLARDNSALASILVEYSHDGSSYATLTKLEQINAYGDIAAGTVPVAEFGHGDSVYLRAVATDAAGNSCEATVVSYVMDLQAPTVSDVTARYEEGTVVLSWTGGDEADLAGYRIYRRSSDGTNSMIGKMAAEPGRIAYTWTDESLPESGGTFSYQIEAVDAVGNTATGSSTETAPGENTPVVEIPERTGPTALLVCDSFMTSGVEYIIDGSGSVDDGYIVSYEYDFGDGFTGTGKSAVHAYAAEGTYILSLTVTDNDGNTHTVARKVIVKSPELVGQVTVRIVDEKGAPVPNAPVYFDLGEEHQVIRGTDASGYATFTAEVGRHTVGCVILNNQWLPVKRDLIVNAGETTSVSMTLINKPIVEGSFEIKRMTLEEIEAAGIDLSDPANQYYVEVVLHLEYGNAELTETIPGNLLSGGSLIFDPTGKWKPKKKDDDDEPDPVVIIPGIVGGGGGGGVRGWSFELIDKSEDPKLMILDIPIGVQSLKEMFDVRLHILNNSSSDFSMKDNVITLDTPDGLSVVTDAYMANKKTVNVAEIPGQTQKTVEWIVRGDQTGEYFLGADYSGTLTQFNEPLTARFEAKDPIQVYGMSGLTLEIIYADQLDKGTLYYNVMLTNDGEVDVYKPVISTADTLIEMELFDQIGRTKAEMVDYSAESVSKIGLATSLNALPDVLKVGESLVLHYMCIDQTDYTHCKMKLEDAALEYQHTYGLSDENVKHYSRPLAYFKASFSASINPIEKAQQTLNENADAFNRLMDNYRYISWCIANNLVPEHYLPDDAEEQAWEFAQGEFLTSHDADMEQAKALILELLALTADATEEAQYSTFFKWLGAISKVVRALKMEGLSKAQSDAFKDTFSYLTDTFQMTYQYMVDNNYTFDELFVKTWEIKCAEKGATFVGNESANAILHEVYAREEMVNAWKHIGLELEVAEKVVKGLEETAVDVGVYLKAQANVETYLFLLNQLILNADTSAMENAYTKADTWIVVDSLTEIRDAIAAENFVGKLADNVLENIAQMAQGKAVDWATDKLLEVAGASAGGIFQFAKALVKVTAMGLDALMNISEQYKKADNLKFIAILSDAAAIAVTDAQARLDGTVKPAEEYMELLTLMLDIRALGESQLALYGKSFETPFTLGNLSLLKAVRKMSFAEESTSWYQWRNIVEDRISLLRVELLRNPVTTEVTGRERPTVSFDYQNSRTIQSFDSRYEYSLDKGTTWTTCSGGPIEVQRPETSVELWVRRVNRSQTDMVGTGSVIIYGPQRLYNSGIEVLKTPTGYRIENLNGDKRYQVTFSAAPLTLDYESDLALTLPEGSNSYVLDTEDEYRYVYIRTLADKNSYASYVTRLNAVSTVTLKTYTTGEGLVMDHEDTWEYGAEVSLTAVPAESRFFDGWYHNGARVSGDQTYTFRIYGSMYLEARFLQAEEVPLPGVSTEVDPVAGTAEVVLEDGTAIAVSGIPQAAFKLVVETGTEEDTVSWVTGCLENIGLPVQIYDIYLLDDRLERMETDGLTISVAYSGSLDDKILCGIEQDEDVNVLQSQAEDGKLTFTGDESVLYVLTGLLPDRCIELEVSADELLPGQKAELSALFQPANPTGTHILWSLAEGDEAYASLAASGSDAVLTALNTTGSRSVTVTASAADGSFPSTAVQILVLPYVYKLSILADDEDVTGKTVKFDINREGNMLQLTAVAAPEDAIQDVTWQSSDEEIAEVTESGLVTFMEKTGPVKVTAFAADGSKKSAAVTIHVVALTQNVEMLEGSVSELVGGQSAKFQARDADTGITLTKTQLTWSLDEEYAPYASISWDGTLNTRTVAEETKIVITGRVVGNEENGVVEHEVILRPKATYVELWYEDRVVNGETIRIDTAGAVEENLPSIRLEAALHPGDARQGVTWKTKDTGIVTVDQNGVVTVKWNAKTGACKTGTVTVTATATDGSKSVGSVKLNFGVFVKQVEIEAPALELRSGKKMTLTAETTPIKPTKTGVTWSLAGENDSSFASISSTGKLTAKTVYDEHTVIVRATAKDGSGVYDEIPVLILPKKDGILTIHKEGKNVTKTTVPVNLNDTNEVTLEAYTLGETELEEVRWKTSSTKNTTLVDNGDGTVTVTLKKSGGATITATAEDGRTAAVTVKGVKLTEEITVSAKSGDLTLAAGRSLTLKAAVKPTDATSKTVLWSVAEKDAEYASISSGGKLTAAKNLLAARTVTVIARAKDGGAEQTAEVLLTPLATGIGILLDDEIVTNTTVIHNMRDGETLQAEAAVYPLKHASESVTWKSSNKKIATVSQDGEIICKKAGIVTITAMAADGSKVKAAFKLKVEKWMTELTLPETAVIAGSKSLTMTKLQGYLVDPYATNKTLIWSMEGEGAAFASLSSKGVLKTAKVTEPKTLTVTATAADGGKISASCEVTIYPATTKVRILCDEAVVTKTLTLAVGESLDLDGTSLPISAAELYTWKSSSRKYATVDADGVVTGVKAGKTISISCLAADGSGKSAVVKIKIVKAQ